MKVDYEKILYSKKKKLKKICKNCKYYEEASWLINKKNQNKIGICNGDFITKGEDQRPREKGVGIEIDFPLFDGDPTYNCLIVSESFGCVNFEEEK